MQVRISVSELLFLTVTANILTTSELKSVDCFNRVLRDNIPLCWSVSQSIGWLVGGSVGWSVVPFSAAASKGLMTYAFTVMGNFLLLLLLLRAPLKSQS